MNENHLAPDEPLSPELVLVLPPELRAQAIARLERPAWARPRQRAPQVSEPADEPFLRSLAGMAAARLVALAMIFVSVTVITLALSAVANAFR